MERIVFSKDQDKYSTSRARWCRYYFEQDNKQCLLLIGESDDYFYFTISRREGGLKDIFSIRLKEDSMIYNQFANLLKGFNVIDVMEEGTPERKSLCFRKLANSIEIIFNLTQEEKVFSTIEFANLRRLGDTRFKNLVDDNGQENQDIEVEREFRYKFKVRLHNLLNDLENAYKNKDEKLHQI